MVGKPEIVTKRVDGKLMEPVEKLTIDVPEEFVGVVMEQLGSRKSKYSTCITMAMDAFASSFESPAAD